MRVGKMKLVSGVPFFYALLAVVSPDENDESDGNDKKSLLETHALPLIEEELKQLQSYSEQRYDFSLRLIPFFENYSINQNSSFYTMTMIQILGGSSEVTFETSDYFKKIINEIWSLSLDKSNLRIGEFEQCMQNEMGELKIGEVLNWAKDLANRDEPQIELAMSAIRRAKTAVEVDLMTINALNAECAARVLLTLPQRYSVENVCYRRSINCKQRCFYVENTRYCVKSWKPRRNVTSVEVKNIMEEVVNVQKYEHFELDEDKFPSYLTEENFNTNIEQLKIVAPIYFTMRNNITEVFQALDNQRRILAFIKDGLPVEETIEDEFDFDSLPDVSEKDISLADSYLRCIFERRRQNYQEYFYDRLHCKDSEFVSGMLLVANLVDEFNMARIGLACFADIEDAILNRYSEILSEEVLPFSLKD